eukprot:959915-Amphidinium_carterae.1
MMLGCRVACWKVELGATVEQARCETHLIRVELDEDVRDRLLHLVVVLHHPIHSIRTVLHHNIQECLTLLHHRFRQHEWQYNGHHTCGTHHHNRTSMSRKALSLNLACRRWCRRRALAQLRLDASAPGPSCMSASFAGFPILS